MLQFTRIALFLLEQLIAALQANDPDLFKRRLCGGIQDLRDAAVTEYLLDWLDAFLTETERDRIVAWHLGVSFLSFWVSDVDKTLLLLE